MARAQISIQFNWIFVLIVGVIVLGFFLMLTNTQQKKATVEEATDLIQNIDTVFTTISKEANAVQSFPIPNADITFTCEPGLSQYYIQGTGPIPTPYDVIFTTDSLKGSEIITWTKSWNIPFESAIFTFMTNDRTLFLFVTMPTSPDQNAMVTSLYEEMPDAFDKRLISVNDISGLRASGYDRYVFVNHNSSIGNIVPEVSTHFDYPEKSVIRSFLPDGTNSYDTYGKVTFAAPAFSLSDAKKGTKTYLHTASLWGTIFTEDKDTYECTIQKALLRTRIAATVLQKRSQMIQNELISTYCFSDQAIAEGDFADLITATETFDAALMYEISNDLEELASDSLRGYSCPYLY